MDTRWKHPFTAIVSGPTSCGKTVFVKRFLAQLPGVCDTLFDRILFYYSEWQDAYKRDFTTPPGCGYVEFIEGLPQLSDYSGDNDKKKLIIIDDLMREASNGGSILDLFTKHSHHKNISIIFITQNLFYKGQRDISLNASYLVIFKNPRDRAQIQYLARQVYPEDPKFLQEAYMDSTSRAHGYLLLDLKQSTLDEYRFRTCIFPDDPTHYVYVPKFGRMIK